MIKNTNIIAYTKTATLSSEGIQSFTYAESFRCAAGVLPVALTETVLKEWGLTTIGENARQIYLEGRKPLTEGMAVKDIGTGLSYDVRAVNPWLISTQGLMELFQDGTTLP